MAGVLTSAGPLVFGLLDLIALWAVAYGVFSDVGSGITTRVRDETRPEDYFKQWGRGTR
jgi:hypothetical protein